MRKQNRKYASMNTTEITMVTAVVLRIWLVTSETSHANRQLTASENSGSASTITTNAAMPVPLVSPYCSHETKTGRATTSSSTKFMASSAAMRLSRIMPGGTGMDRSSSLSFASNSCDLAVNTLPMNMSAKAMIANMAKYSQPSPAGKNAAASWENEV